MENRYFKIIMYQIDITVIVAEFWYYKFIKGSALFVFIFLSLICISMIF